MSTIVGWRFKPTRLLWSIWKWRFFV